MRSSGIGGLLERLDAVLDDIAAIDATSLCDTTVAALVQAYEPRHRRMQAQRSRLFALADQRGVAQLDGAPSTAAWLRGRLRIGDPRRQLAIAATARDVPEIGAAYLAGDISEQHVAALAKVVPDIPQEVLAAGVGGLLADHARQLGPHELGRFAVLVREHYDPANAEERARKRFERRGLWVSRTFDGMVAVDGLLDPEAGSQLIETLRRLSPPPCDGDERTAPQRRADALVELCRLVASVAEEGHGEGHGEGHAKGHAGHDVGWAERRPSGRVVGRLPQVIVTVDLRTLRGSGSCSGSGPGAGRAIAGTGATSEPVAGATGVTSAGALAGALAGASPGPATLPAGPERSLRNAGWGAELGDGTSVAASTARRLACDAMIIPAVLGGRGEPLDLGRAQRVVSTALRRALHLRDGRCRFPGCDRPPQWTDGHHLIAWADGGPTNLDNMVSLCRWHHTAVHEGGWRVHLDTERNIVTATRPDGRPFDLVSRPRPRPP